MGGFRRCGCHFHHWHKPQQHFAVLNLMSRSDLVSFAFTLRVNKCYMFSLCVVAAGVDIAELAHVRDGRALQKLAALQPSYTFPTQGHNLHHFTDPIMLIAHVFAYAPRPRPAI
jgi:hypothetical protein